MKKIVDCIARISYLRCYDLMQYLIS